MRRRLVVLALCLGTLLLIVICSGLLAGGIVFGIHAMPTLSGTSLSVVDGLARILASGAFIVLAAFGIVAVGTNSKSLNPRM